MSLTNSPFGCVSSIDPDTGENVCLSISPMMDKAVCQIKDSISFPRGEDGYGGLLGHSLNTLKPFFTNNPASHPSFKGLPEGHTSVKRFLSVPTVYGGELYGQIALANADCEYTQEDLNVADALAHLFAMAVFRKRMENSMAEHRQKLQKAHDALEEQVKERTKELKLSNEQLMQEIEERQRTMDDLRKSEERYRDIFENAVEGVSQSTPEGRFINVNPSMARICGYESPEEMIAAITDISQQYYVDPSAREKFIRLIHEHGHMDNMEYRIYRKDGSISWVRANVRAVRNDQGDLLYYEGSSQDITQLKYSELQLLHSQKKLQTIFDGISEPLVLVDKNMVIQMVNVAAVRYYQCISSQDLIGLSACGGICDKKDGCDMCVIPSAVLGDKYVCFERQGFMDPTRLESVTIFPISSEVENDACAVIRISDITEAKMMEKAMIRSEKLASIGLLTSGVAHEINNPNNFVMFNIPVLKRYLGAILPIVKEHADADSSSKMLFNMTFDEFENDLFELMDSIETGSERIKNIIAELKDFSAVGDPKETIWGNPEKTIAQAVRIAGVQLKNRIQRLDVDIPKDLPDAFFEARGLEQVIVNILINAVYAVDKEDSWIRLNAKIAGEGTRYFVIEITDNGSGIDEKSLGKIFDPFFTTKSPGEGTGLGLYVCHNLVEKMGGHIDVESQVGEGATFRIVLRCK